MNNMIRSNELRIGSWLKVNDLFVTVSGMSVNSFTCTHRGLIYFNSEDCQPIALDNEILNKCGFKKDYDGFYCIDIGRKWFSIIIDYSIVDICFKSDIGLKAINLNSEIEYLHQLQNLIFALTGTELEINF